MIDLGVQRAQFEHAIAVLVGAPATDFHIAEKPLAGDPPAVPTGIPSQLLQRRPDIASSERRVAATNALIGVAKSAYYPNITLGAGGGLESDLVSQVFNASSATWYAGPSVNELIYDGGRRSSANRRPPTIGSRCSVRLAMSRISFRRCACWSRTRLSRDAR